MMKIYEIQFFVVSSIELMESRKKPKDKPDRPDRLTAAAIKWALKEKGLCKAGDGCCNNFFHSQNEF